MVCKVLDYVAECCVRSLKPDGRLKRGTAITFFRAEYVTLLSVSTIYPKKNVPHKSKDKFQSNNNKNCFQSETQHVEFQSQAGILSTTGKAWNLTLGTGEIDIM